MTFDLVLEREFAHPVERLWWALTDRDAIAGWFMDTDLKAVLGSRFTIRGKPDGVWRGWTDCEILELEPMRRIVWSFDCEDGYPPTIVTFTLRASGKGTALTLRHHGRASRSILEQTERSWPGFLDRLASLLRVQAGVV